MRSTTERAREKTSPTVDGEAKELVREQRKTSKYTSVENFTWKDLTELVSSLEHLELFFIVRKCLSSRRKPQMREMRRK